MKYERLEVRLDEEHVKKLAEVRAAYSTSASEAVRRAIDEAYEKMKIEQRKRALQTIRQAELVETPEPEELRGQVLSDWDKRVENLP
jgi:hypothetical protein